MEFSFDYFTKEDLESFNFFRVPKALFTKEIFKSLSVEEKILYSAFLDRISLSQKNSWIDKEGKVYIIYTNSEIEEYFGFSKGSTVKYMKNLEKIGLIEKRVRGLGLPNLIYVKNFAKIEKENEFKNEIENNEDNSKNLLENQNLDSRDTEDEIQKSKNCTPEVQKVSTIKTDISKTNYINTNINNQSIINYVDRLIDKFNNKIIFYDESYKKAYEEVLKIIKNTLQTKSDITVSGISVPFSKYFEKFKLLEKSHFEYVLSCYFKNFDRIVNFKSYILSVLYSSLDKVGLNCKEKILNLNLSDRNRVYDKVIDDFFRKKSFSMKKENDKEVDKGNFFERLAMREKTSNFRYAFA